MTLDFFKQKYGYDIDGAWMPRVTAITSVISRSFSFPGAFSYAEWGTMVHEAVEDVLRGEKKETPERVAPSVAAFSQWLSENAVALEQEHIERRVIDWEERYAGTLDVAATVNGRKGVIDIKTGLETRKEFLLQTAAYLAAFNKETGWQAEARWILRLDQYEACRGCTAKKRSKASRAVVAGGKQACNHQWGRVRGEVEFEELKDFEQDLAAFLAAKEVWEWQHRDLLRHIRNYPVKMVQRTLIG